MRKFLKDLSLFCLLVLTTLVGIYSLSFESNNFLHAIGNKQERLKENLNPQIIIVGGSNTVFGIDSQMLRDSLGYDVVNMGLHVALGYDFLIKQIINDLREGDRIILSPEYILYFQDYYLHEGILLSATLHYPEILFQLQKENRGLLFYKHFVQKFQWNITKLFQTSRDTLQYAYSLVSMNEYGDQTGHLKLKSPEKLKGTPFSQYLNKQTPINPFFLETTEQLVQKCKILGCDLFITFPPQPKSFYDGEIMENLHEALKEQAIPLLGTPKDFIFADALFFDTADHLNRTGRQIRTQKLVQYLKKHFTSIDAYNEHKQ